jgi:hypothetical protein
MSTPEASARSSQDRPTAIAWAIASRAAWLLPLLVAVAAAGPSLWALHEQSFAILGRDHGIFQYVAWALRNGDRAYRDIHEINGPLPHAWHIVMQLLGGEDEHTFRLIDTALLVTVYLFASWTLPRWVGLDLSLRSDGTQGARSAAWARLFWMLAGIGVLGAQYARYDWWHTAQREGLYSMLVLGSLALQSIGHTTSEPRRAVAAFFFAGLGSSLAWFGKPPCAIFSVLQVAVLWLDRANVRLPLRRVSAAAGAGAVVSFAAMLAFVLTHADPARGIEILSKVPRLHHTIWNESLRGIYRAYNNAPRLDWAFATFACFVVAYRVLGMPRRALLAAVLPIGGFLVFVGQGKAFPYHLHMLTLGTGVAQLVIMAGLARYMQSAHDRCDGVRAWTLVTTAALAPAAALGLGLKSAEDALLSPGVKGRWSTAGATAELRASRAYVDLFPWGDFFANDLRDAAGYLAFHTLPDERIQTYGFDPYLLFLARRKSASPVIYNFELNVDAALEGGPGARPSEEQKAWLRAYRDEAEELVLRAVEASPPAAFVLLDRAPFTHPESSEKDFATHCPKLNAWMSERYVRAAVFGTVRIWLRRDVLERSRPH